MDNRFPVSKIRPVHGTQFCANRNTVLAKEMDHELKTMQAQDTKVLDDNDTTLSLKTATFLRAECGPSEALHLSNAPYDTIRYDDIYVRPKANIQPAKSAARNQTKRIMKKLKIKTEMLRRIGPVIKSWGQS